MIDAKDAKTKTQESIQTKMNHANQLVEREVNTAISQGLFSTTVAGQELLDEEIRTDLVRRLKSLGYDISHTSGKTISDSVIKITWANI